MKKVFASLALASSLVSAMTIAAWNERTGGTYHARWNSGEVINVYENRAVNLRGLKAEKLGGYNTCKAIVAAGIERQECKDFGLVRR